jgi:4-amino-4-deoxy-L-arabinose transferase-like glycosyltransferase
MQHDERNGPIEAPTRSPNPSHANILYFVLLVIAGFFVARIPVLSHQFFDPDEFEHAHAAWCVFKGMIPYKDFFEHHTPFYYYALSPFFHWFRVDQSFDSARHFLTFARGLSLLGALLSVALVFLLGRLLAERRVGVWAGFLLVVQPFFFEKMAEIRPDVLAHPFFVGSLCFLQCGLARDTDSVKRRLWPFLGSGLCLGAAIMCTQKMLFVLPGLLTGLGIWALFSSFHGGTNAGRGSRMLSVVAFLAGIGVTVGLTWAAFALHHGGSQFIGNNFLLNSKWKAVSHEQLLRMLEASWPALLLCLLGASAAMVHFFRSQQPSYGRFVLLCTLTGLAVGLLIVPVAHRQYYLISLPIIALFAADGLFVLVDLAREGMRPRLLALAVMLLSVLPVLDLRDAMASRNDGQLARLHYVFESTKPTDVVMDGIEGTGVFRPHALYHYFFHGELLLMLSRQQLDAYVDALESGKIRPKMIALDENLIVLGSRFLRFVKKNYVSSDGFFYFSKGGSD